MAETGRDWWRGREVERGSAQNGLSDDRKFKAQCFDTVEIENDSYFGVVYTCCKLQRTILEWSL